MNYALAPIVLFSYKRLTTLKNAINSLQNNKLAKDSDLIVFSDGPSSIHDKTEIDAVRNYLSGIEGFKSVFVFYSSSNKGLSISIIEGVTTVMNQYGKAIVLEDDLVYSTNFLQYMNQALDYFQNKSNVVSVSGYTPKISGLQKNDIYFTLRSSSWGWASWKDRWDRVDWELGNYNAFRQDKKLRFKFAEMGSDLNGLLDLKVKGKIESWAIVLNFHQFQNNLFSVFPAVSKVKNMGFGDDKAVNTRIPLNRFFSDLDISDNVNFNFTKRVMLEKGIIKQFVNYYSYWERLKSKFSFYFKLYHFEFIHFQIVFSIYLLSYIQYF